MRAILIAALMAFAIGLAGSAPGSAAPVNPGAIGAAADAGHVVDQVRWRHWRRHRHWHHGHYWRWRHHRHCWWHHHHRHCRWW
jgi:hypothetical protein